MTAETITSSRRRGGMLFPILALVAGGVILRFTFVDLLTKATGTWMGGVESPHRTSPRSSHPSSPSKGPSAA